MVHGTDRRLFWRRTTCRFHHDFFFYVCVVEPLYLLVHGVYICSVRGLGSKALEMVAIVPCESCLSGNEGYVRVPRATDEREARFRIIIFFHLEQCGNVLRLREEVSGNRTPLRTRPFLWMRAIGYRSFVARVSADKCERRRNTIVGARSF